MNSYTTYKTFCEAEKHLMGAIGGLSHGGKQDIQIEQVPNGYALAEYKFINNQSVFMGFYKERE